MGIILKTRKHILTRFPLWLGVIIFLALSPFIIGFIGSYLTEFITNKDCHEGNCFWGVIPWIGVFITLPLGALTLLVFLIIILIDCIKLYKIKN